MNTLQEGKSMITPTVAPHPIGLLPPTFEPDYVANVV
jgi:hypothetical protein